MNHVLLGLASILIGYILGSIPAAYLMAKWRKGIDIRDVDVGNVGAGAIFRTCGKTAGGVVAAVDIGKGVATIFIAQGLQLSELWVIAAGFAAIVGHSYPVFIGFKGGQGAATIIGEFLVLEPIAMGITLIPLAIILFSRPHLFAKRLFFAVFITSPLLPVLIWVFGGSIWLIIYSVIAILSVVLRNLNRKREMAGGLTGNTRVRQ
jgi:glycerol-3-phosphate acyltransferase PlsY